MLISLFFPLKKFEPSASMQQMGWMSFEGFARYVSFEQNHQETFSSLIMSLFISIQMLVDLEQVFIYTKSFTKQLFKAH